MTLNPQSMVGWLNPLPSSLVSDSTVAVVGDPVTGQTYTATLPQIGAGPLYNVKAYGAKGDGVTDDTSAINATITAALAASAAVFFPAGNYKVTGQLTLGSNLHVFGQGREVTTLTYALAGGIGMYASGKTSIAVEGLAFAGLVAMGLVYDTCTKVSVRHCSFTGCTSSTHATGYAGGVHAWVSDDVTIEANYFSGNGYIGSGLSADIQINGNGANTGSERIRIVGNRCLSVATQYGIAAYDLQHSEISGNVCSGAKTGAGNNNGYGILTYKTASMTGAFMRDNRIENNTVYSVGGTGIYVQAVTRTVVAGNAVYDAGVVQDDTSLPVGGIAVNNSSDVTVVGNTVSTCAKAGIVVGGTPCDGHVVTGNAIDTVTGAGISVRGALQRASITNNSIKSASTKGIGTFPSDSGSFEVTIAGNQIQSAGLRGIDYYGLSRSVISGNTVSGSGGDAIAITTGANLAILGNTLYDGGTLTTNTYIGLELTAVVSSLVMGNLIGNTGGTGFKWGITANVASTGLTVAANRLSGLLTAPLSIASTSTTVIRDNDGYNPVGASAITVTASPMTYTAGNSPEAVSIMGGTVSTVTKGGVNVATATNCVIRLAPNQALVVTYTVAPTMTKDVQ